LVIVRAFLVPANEGARCNAVGYLRVREFRVELLKQRFAPLPGATAHRLLLRP
jgi:hypothetical protein